MQNPMEYYEQEQWYERTTSYVPKNREHAAALWIQGALIDAAYGGIQMPQHVRKLYMNELNYLPR